MLMHIDITVNLSITKLQKIVFLMSQAIFMSIASKCTFMEKLRHISVHSRKKSRPSRNNFLKNKNDEV